MHTKCYKQLLQTSAIYPSRLDVPYQIERKDRLFKQFNTLVVASQEFFRLDMTSSFNETSTPGKQKIQRTAEISVRVFSQDLRARVKDLEDELRPDMDCASQFSTCLLLSLLRLALNQWLSIFTSGGRWPMYTLQCSTPLIAIADSFLR